MLHGLAPWRINIYYFGLARGNSVVPSYGIARYNDTKYSANDFNVIRKIFAGNKLRIYRVYLK